MMEKYGAEQELYNIEKKVAFNDEGKNVATNLSFDEAVQYLNKDANYKMVPQAKGK